MLTSFFTRLVLSAKRTVGGSCLVLSTLVLCTLVLTNTTAHATNQDLTIDVVLKNFGNQTTGIQGPAVCVTITNTGTSGNLVISGTDVSGSLEWVVTSIPGAIAPGQSASLCMKFTPILTGFRNTTLTVYSNGTVHPAETVTLTGYGIQPKYGIDKRDLFLDRHVHLGDSATESVVIDNSGIGKLLIYSTSLIGPGRFQYRISRTPTDSIPPGSRDTITVIYKPTTEYQHDARLIIQSNSFNKPLDTVHFTGYGTLQHLVITPEILAFDSVGVASTDCRDLRLTNPGTANLYIKSEYLLDNTGSFVVTPLHDTERVIRPGNSRLLKVCFTPKNQGSLSDRIRILTDITKTLEDPSRDTSAFVVQLTGTGMPFGKLSINPTPKVDSVSLNQELCRDYAITNTGSASLTIDGASFLGINSAGYSLKATTFPFTLGINQSKTITVCFTQLSLPGGRHDAQLQLSGTSNNRAFSSTLDILTFVFGNCAEITGTQFGPTCLGLLKEQQFTVRNCGEQAANYQVTLAGSSAPLPGGFKIVSQPQATPIQPGAIANFTVSYQPTELTSDTAVLNIEGLSSLVIRGSGAVTTVSSPGAAVPNTLARDTSAPFDLKLYNDGACNWQPGIPEITGPFIYVTGGEQDIPSGGSATIQLRFAPQAPGTHTGVISFGYSIPNLGSPFKVTIQGTANTSGVTRIAESGFKLEQNYPNPAGSSAMHGSTMTEIRFAQPKTARVTIELRDSRGALVRTLSNAVTSGGAHSVVLNTEGLATGSYYYTLTAGEVSLTRQMVVTR